MPVGPRGANTLNAVTRYPQPVGNDGASFHAARSDNPSLKSSCRRAATKSHPPSSANCRHYFEAVGRVAKREDNYADASPSRAGTR
jgi:hypothetical protein